MSQARQRTPDLSRMSKGGSYLTADDHYISAVVVSVHCTLMMLYSVSCQHRQLRHWPTPCVRHTRLFRDHRAPSSRTRSPVRISTVAGPSSWPTAFRCTNTGELGEEATSIAMSVGIGIGTDLKLVRKRTSCENISSCTLWKGLDFQ